MSGVLNATHGKARRRLAIVGCGSSGLITLKYACDLLPDWEIQCFEASGEITGCWGDPYPGFVSTSTKFTTQFACFPKYSANTSSAPKCEKNEFFQGDEYGQYLSEFAAQLWMCHGATASAGYIERRAPNSCGDDAHSSL